ncbi:sensor histidine kinase [Nitrosococcus wardiae]|uniref:HAMP domain-containing histidine kinase n=1 Tax=Nitrosococcus wardiae TaxID=1814290 RepID=A0A4P7BXM2_9GAMM|nr:hypothetical protein [Nitrosococcus wardiae]QBQ54761.1 hypothetical protein E3U44_09750 [Nitrosococcus wardiae]
MDASRVTSGGVPLKTQPCDLVALVEECAEVAQTAAAEHRIVVQCLAAVEAVVDPLRMEQVLANLLDNATKFSPPGSQIAVDGSEWGDIGSIAPIPPSALGGAPREAQGLGGSAGR